MSKHADKRAVLLFYGAGPGEREFTEEEITEAIQGLGRYGRGWLAIRALLCEMITAAHEESLSTRVQGTHEATLLAGEQRALLDAISRIEERFDRELAGDLDEQGQDAG